MLLAYNVGEAVCFSLITLILDCVFFFYFLHSSIVCDGVNLASTSRTRCDLLRSLMFALTNCFFDGPFLFCPLLGLSDF